MKCLICASFFNEATQSPCCPHPGTSREPAPGGPVLRPFIKHEIDEAYQSKNAETLRLWSEHPNFAASYYAGLLLKQLEEQEAKKEADSAL